MSGATRQLAPQGGTRLVTNPDAPQVWTDQRVTDCRSAQVRALKEYLEQCPVAWPGSRPFGALRVIATWAENEVPGEFPAVVVWTPEPGVYDASQFTPSIDPAMRVGLADKYLYLQKVAELEQPIAIDVWTNDVPERMALVAAIEDALAPVDWMVGVRLEMPHYYGARVVVDPLGVQFEDTAVDAQSRIRKARIDVTARSPWLRLVGPKPPLQARVDWTISEE